MRTMGTIFFVAAFFFSRISSWCIGAHLDEGLPGGYLDFGAGARALGMGGAFVALADDASSVYHNPAGLTQLKTVQLSTLYTTLFEDTSYGFFALVCPTRRFGTFGVGGTILGSGGFEIRDTPDETKEAAKFDDTRWAVSLSHAMTPFRSVSIGANLKVVGQKIHTYQDTGLGFDIGLLFRPWRQLSLGLVLQNLLSPRLKLKEVTEKFPFTTKLGGVVRLMDDALRVAFDIKKKEHQSYKFYLGGEWWLYNVVALRGGLDHGEPCGGLGIKWKNYRVDYAFSSQTLGPSHRISFTWASLPFRVITHLEPKVFSPVGKLNCTKLMIEVKRRHRVKTWRLRIEDAKGQLVRLYKGKKAPPDEIVWDGRDENGKTLPDGEYTLTLEVMDVSEDVYRSGKNKVRIVTDLPEVEVPIKIGQ